MSHIKCRDLYKVKKRLLQINNTYLVSMSLRKARYVLDYNSPDPNLFVLQVERIGTNERERINILLKKIMRDIEKTGAEEAFKRYQNAECLILIDLMMRYVKTELNYLSLILRRGNVDQLKIYESVFEVKVDYLWILRELSSNSVEQVNLLINYIFDNGMEISELDYAFQFPKYTGNKTMKTILELVDIQYFSSKSFFDELLTRYDSRYQNWKMLVKLWCLRVGDIKYINSIRNVLPIPVYEEFLENLM